MLLFTVVRITGCLKVSSGCAAARKQIGAATDTSGFSSDFSGDQNLSAAYCHACTRLPEGFQRMRSSEKADWRRYRHTWSDVLVDAAAAVGEQRALQLLLQPLAELSQASSQGREFDWRMAELALHCIRYVSQPINRKFPTLCHLEHVHFSVWHTKATAAIGRAVPSKSSTFELCLWPR